MKVLFWSANFWPNLGGLERISQELVLSLVRAGIEVRVVAPLHPQQPAHSRWQGIPIYRFPLDDPAALCDLNTLFRIKQELQHLKRDWGPHLVHISGCTAGLLLHQLTPRVGLPTLLTLHGEIPGADSAIPSLYQNLLRTADWICCCSEWTLQELRRHLPECHEHASVVLNALPLPEFTRPTASSTTLLCAGRLASEKGFETAVRALPHCHAEIRLELAGDGPLRGPLQQLADELGLGERVAFLGRLEPQPLLHKMGQSMAVLVPSTSEGFGLTALEAAWAGTPVIASEVGGLPEVVCQGVTGWLVPVNQPQALARAVQVLHHDPPGARQMGINAGRWAREKFSWSDFVNSYIQRYQQLVRR